MRIWRMESASPIVHPQPDPAPEGYRLLREGRPADAVVFALDRGLDDLAAELLAAGSSMLVRIVADYDRFFELVQRIGVERVRRWPELEAAAIWILAVGNRQRLASVRLDELEARIPELHREGRSFVPQSRDPFDRIDPESAMQCWVGMMRIVIAAYSGAAEEALQRAELWHRQFPRTTEYDRATVRGVCALAAVMLGRFPEAEHEARAAMASFRDGRIPFGLSWCASCAACSQIRQGRIAEGRATIDEALRRMGNSSPASRVQLPLRMVSMLALFESGEFHAGLVGRSVSALLLPLRAESAALAELANPVMAMEALRCGARGLLALGEGAEALRLLDSAHFDGTETAVAWWQRHLALERARTAAIAGIADRRGGAVGDEAEILQLIEAAVRRPEIGLLRPLRSRIEAAEERCDADGWALCVFLKARVELATGQTLQAKRSVQRLLVSPLSRERIGTLASLAQGLRPIFETVLQDLLANPASDTPGLRRLALILGQRQPAPRGQAVDFSLTPREQEIAAALLQGCSNREIAGQLYLTEKTVKWHLGRLFQKLGVRNRVGAVRALALQLERSPPV